MLCDLVLDHIEVMVGSVLTVLYRKVLCPY